nr:MAG TPA: hypothetical protein [Bacteriophage sp.]
MTAGECQPVKGINLIVCPFVIGKKLLKKYIKSSIALRQ